MIKKKKKKNVAAAVFNRKPKNELKIKEISAG